MAPARVWVPAFSIMARMISALEADLATMRMTSRSLAREKPMNFSVVFTPVPLAEITVPPRAPAVRAASMTSSVKPSLRIT